MRNSLIFLLFISLSASAAEPSSRLERDSRFNGIDIIQHVRLTYPELRLQAEEISHWSGYYDVNPMLLTELSLAELQGELSASLSVREQALNLRAVANRNLAGQDLVTALGDQFGLSGPAASTLLGKSRDAEKQAALPPSRTQASDQPPALDLPFVDGSGWQFNGVHTWTGSDDNPPMSSIDFVRSWTQKWGDDTSADFVTSSHDGQVTKFSECFIHVQHDSGWGTRYYHLDALQVDHGDLVKAGDVIGIYANDEDQALCSGGHSTGPHLHFALQRDNAYFSLQDIEFSGYRVHPGTSSYDSNQSRMWLEKRGEKFFAFADAISQEPGDNVIDYRYSGMWYSPQVTGHGMNIEITEFPDGEGGTRLSVFVAFYTYDDAGEANFYVASGDVERWRADESITLDLLQTAGGDLTNLASIDFNNPSDVAPAGQIQIGFTDCENASVQLSITERTTSQELEHDLQLLRLIGVPTHVCKAPSLALPETTDQD